MNRFNLNFKPKSALKGAANAGNSSQGETNEVTALLPGEDADKLEWWFKLWSAQNMHPMVLRAVDTYRLMNPKNGQPSKHTFNIYLAILVKLYENDPDMIEDAHGLIAQFMPELVPLITTLFGSNYIHAQTNRTQGLADHGTLVGWAVQHPEYVYQGLGPHRWEDSPTIKSFIQWASRSARPDFARSTSMSDGGRRSATADALTVAQNLHSLLVQQLVGVNECVVTTVPDREPTPEEKLAKKYNYKEGDSTTSFLDVNYSHLNPTPLSKLQRDIYISQVSLHRRENPETYYLGNVEVVTGHQRGVKLDEPLVHNYLETSPDLLAWVFSGLTEDPMEMFHKIYTKLTPYMTTGAHQWNISSIITAKALHVLQMIENGSHPDAVAHYALYDVFDFVTLAEFTTLHASQETFLSFAEHIVAKLRQLLDARGISIQTTMQRSGQTLNQAMIYKDSPCNLTGGRSDSAKVKVGNFFHHMAEPTNGKTAPASLIQEEEGAVDPLESKPQNRFASGASAPATEINNSWKDSLDTLAQLPIRGKLMRLCSARKPDFYTRWLEQATTAAKILIKADPDTDDSVIRNACSSRGRDAYLNWAIASWARPAEHRYEGQMAKVMEYASNLVDVEVTPQHMITLGEGDMSKFTVASATPSSTGFSFLAPHGHHGFTAVTKRLAYGLYQASAKIKVMFDEHLLHGFKDMGKKIIGFSYDLLKNSISEEQRVRLGLTPTVNVAPSNGATSQGFNPAMTSVHGFVSWCMCAGTNLITVNGDDHLYGVHAPMSWKLVQSVAKKTLPDGVPGMDFTKPAQEYDTICAGSNLAGLALTRILAETATGNVFSSKKTGIAFAISENASGSVTQVAGKIGSRDYWVAPSGSAYATFSSIPEVSVPALVAHCTRNGVNSLNYESGTDEAKRRIIDFFNGKLGPLVDAYSRHRKLTPMSIWSGKTTVFSDPEEALAEVLRDPEAPQWAKNYALNRYLVFPKGVPCRREFRRSDKTAPWDFLTQTSTHLKVNRKFHAPESAVDYTSFVAFRFHLTAPLKDESDYESSSMVLVPVQNGSLVTCRVPAGTPVQDWTKESRRTISLVKMVGASNYETVGFVTPSGAVKSMKPAGSLHVDVTRHYTTPATRWTDGENGHAPTISVTTSTYPIRTVNYTVNADARQAVAVRVGQPDMVTAVTQLYPYGGTEFQWTATAGHGDGLAVAKELVKYMAERKGVTYYTLKPGSRHVVSPIRTFLLGPSEQVPNLTCLKGFYFSNAQAASCSATRTDMITCWFTNSVLDGLTPVVNTTNFDALMAQRLVSWKSRPLLVNYSVLQSSDTTVMPGSAENKSEWDTVDLHFGSLRAPNASPASLIVGGTGQLVYSPFASANLREIFKAIPWAVVGSIAAMASHADSTSSAAVQWEVSSEFGDNAAFWIESKQGGFNVSCSYGGITRSICRWVNHQMLYGSIVVAAATLSA